MDTEDFSIIDDILDSTPKYHLKFIDNAMYITAYIKEQLKAKGWMQKDLAEAMGKKEAEISKWLSGTHNFTLRTLTHIQVVISDGESKVQAVIEDEELEYELREQQIDCQYCGVVDGSHMRGCPFDTDPYNELLENGYD